MIIFIVAFVIRIEFAQATRLRQCFKETFFIIISRNSIRVLCNIIRTIRILRFRHLTLFIIRHIRHRLFTHKLLCQASAVLICAAADPPGFPFFRKELLGIQHFIKFILKVAIKHSRVHRRNIIA